MEEIKQEGGIKEVEECQIELCSVKIGLVNDYGKIQNRIISITKERVSILEKDKIKKTFEISDISGLTKNIGETNIEFLVHFSSEPDYRFKCEDAATRDKIFKAIKESYVAIKKANVPIFGVPEDTLEKYQTVKADIKKEINKTPDHSYLLEEEDIPIELEEEEQKEPVTNLVEETKDTKSANDLLGALDISKEEISLQDFRCKKETLFPKMHLAVKLDTKELYALKILNKEDVVNDGKQESIELLKKKLSKSGHPFLVQTPYILENESKYYLFMEFIKSGDFYTYNCKQKRLSEETTKFYAAQIVSAIGYLHSKNIMYRICCLENNMLCEDGYLKLSNFELTKDIADEDLASKFCGVPEYLAPEIVSEEQYNHSVDWWAVGIVIYELIVGFPPFHHKNQSTMFDLIKRFPIKFPDPVRHKIDMSEHVKDIITKLLQKDPSERLGNQGGVEEIKAHPWFKDINFEKLENKEYDAPYIPEIEEISWETCTDDIR
ncbi:unnamed protein product [Moneuplotes crassus]|uniref:Uncharacterized protein n=1 Tax=Euplotes crassus TaxID=5936 RepID=A0AAD1UBS6_EUPCR|nr:unnamed protein product [Moneuplotes crassus]